VDAHLDWSKRNVYMFEKHKIRTSQADEAFDDPERVVIAPDYASISGHSVRVIGFSPSAGDVLTVIVVVDQDDHGRTYGANAWRANEKDRRLYYAKEDRA
jgi:hypothetical protein